MTRPNPRHPRRPRNVTKVGLARVRRRAELVSALTRLPQVAVLLFLVVGYAIGAVWWALLCVFLTSGLSLAYLYWLVKSGRVRRADSISRAERAGPLRVVAGLYAASFLLVSYLGGPVELRAMLLSFAIATVALALFAIFLNPSLHTAGISGTAVCVSYVFGVWGVPVALVILPVWWARSRLERHTSLELALGMAIGACATYFSFEWIV